MFVPKKVVAEDRDGKDLPRFNPSPGGEGKNPGAVPGMQHRAENQCCAHDPQCSAPPVANEEKRNCDHGDDDDDVIMIISLVRVGPEGVLDEPPKHVIESGDVIEFA